VSFKIKILALTHAFDWKVCVPANRSFSCAFNLLSYNTRDFSAILPCFSAEPCAGLEFSLFRYIFSAKG
jgi:hypothetical protein